jgi:hypothetical protein
VRKHTSGTSRPHGEMVGAGPRAGAGFVRMASPSGSVSPQNKRTKMKPAGGKFSVGSGSKPKGMSVYRQGE